MKWNRMWDNWHHIKSSDGLEICTEVEINNEDAVRLILRCDPRTGKPWKSLRIAENWYNSVNKGRRIVDNTI